MSIVRPDHAGPNSLRTCSDCEAPSQVLSERDIPACFRLHVRRLQPDRKRLLRQETNHLSRPRHSTLHRADNPHPRQSLTYRWSRKLSRIRRPRLLQRRHRPFLAHGREFRRANGDGSSGGNAQIKFENNQCRERSGRGARGADRNRFSIPSDAKIRSQPVPKAQSARNGDKTEQAQYRPRRAEANELVRIADRLHNAVTKVTAVRDQTKAGEKPEPTRQCAAAMTARQEPRRDGRQRPPEGS